MNTDTKKLKIQRHLATGASITPMLAARRFHCYSLSQRIGDLTRDGWPIQSEWVKANGSRFKKYRIETRKRGNS